MAAAPPPSSPMRGLTGARQARPVTTPFNTMAARELSPDAMSATAAVSLPTLTGALAAQEAGSDKMSATAAVSWPTLTGALAAQEAGSDTMSAAAAVFLRSVTLNGLTSGEARPGNHASISVTPPGGVTFTSQAWGVGSYGDTTYGTGVNPTDYTESDGQTLLWEATGDDDLTYRASAPIRYAPGTLAIADQSPWTVDDDAVSFSIAPTGTGLTFSNFQISGFPASLSVDASGNVTAASVSFADHQAASGGTGTGSCQDQYGRVYSDTATWSSQLRPQATAGAALNLSFPEDSAITSTDLAQNFTANGNSLTYLLVDTPPAGLSASAETLTGTPTTVTPDANYTFQGTDEYGRVTSVEHAIEITQSFALTETVDGKLEINVATGTVTITITSPAVYANYDAGNGAGVFTFDSSEIASGPVNLVPPQITDDGTPTEGEQITIVPGLWVYDSDDNASEPSTSLIRLRDGAAAGTMTSPYTLLALDAGIFAVRETATGDKGVRSADSASITVAAASGAAINSITDVPGGGLLIDYTGTLTITDAPGGGLIVEVS